MVLLAWIRLLFSLSGMKRRKKSLREKKVGFAEKKLRLQKTVGVSGLQPLHAGGMSLPVGGEGDGFAAFTVWGI